MSKPQWYLKLRAHKDTPWVSLWLMIRDGAAEYSMMWGEVMPAGAEAIVEALGLPVEREQGQIVKVRPVKPPGCASVEEQADLFSVAAAGH